MSEKTVLPEKILCLAAYLFSLPGLLLARFAGKKSSLCLYHARRSLELFLFMFFLFLSWCIVTFVLMFVPYGGFPIAIAMFGIIVAAAFFCLALSIMAIAKVLRGEAVIFPFISSLMSRLRPVFVFLGLPEE